MKTLTFHASKFDGEVMYWYHVKQLSIRQVARELNCCEHRVADVLHTYKPGVRSMPEAMALRSSDEYRDKLRETQTGIRNHQARLVESDIVEIRQLYENALNSGAQKTATQYALAQKYNVKRPTISDIVLRKTWKHL